MLWCEKAAARAAASDKRTRLPLFESRLPGGTMYEIAKQFHPAYS
jgi:hypothetical protein